MPEAPTIIRWARLRGSELKSSQLRGLREVRNTFKFSLDFVWK